MSEMESNKGMYNYIHIMDEEDRGSWELAVSQLLRNRRLRFQEECLGTLNTDPELKETMARAKELKALGVPDIRCPMGELIRQCHLCNRAQNEICQYGLMRSLRETRETGWSDKRLWHSIFRDRGV